MRVLVIGRGVFGLSAALSLRQRGHQVVVVGTRDGNAASEDTSRIIRNDYAGDAFHTAWADEAIEGWLRGRWTGQAAPPEEVRWDRDDCVMMRDPGVPVEVAGDHRLYSGEVDVLMDVWSPRLLQRDGVHLVYREDTAALDALMPVGVYTDMYHYVQWSRLGVVLVEGLQLP